MIDWGLASNVAGMVAGLAPDGPPGPAAPREATFESERLITEYTGLRTREPLPEAEAVARPAWIDSNLASVRGIVDPVAARLGDGLGPAGVPVRIAGGAVLAVELGAISGFLAQRVLGQYEFPILDPSGPARLLFVAPNLASAARALEAEESAVVRWVALHETTHALQFGAVPWLREHLADRVRELLSALEVPIDPRRALRLPRGEELRALVDAVRRGELATLVVGGERRAVLDGLQAMMALVEGYAEHVMDAVGAGVVPGVPRLRAAMERRRRDRSGLLRLFERLIGLDLKLRQYEQGKAFCDGVVRREGIAALNRAWYDPSLLPLLAELDDPAGWIERTRPRSLPAAAAPV